MASSETLRELSELQKWREQCLTVAAQLSLTQPPQALWPIVSNTDMLNAQMGLNPTHNHFSPAPGGGSRLSVETLSAGMKLAYEEFPFNWQAPERLEVERVFRKGPLHYLRFEIRLRPAGTGTQLDVALHFVPALPALAIKGILRLNLAKMLKVLRGFDRQLAAGKPGLRVFYSEGRQALARAGELASAWRALAPESALPEVLARYVCCAPDRYAARIRPFELAALHDLDPLATLRFCLLAARAGHLHLRWDLRCPSCKGPKEHSERLAEVGASAFCPSCAAAYAVGFDSNLELTFFPAGRWRRVDESHFCAGSPANTSHLALQHNLWPGQRERLQLALPPGAYCFRSPSLAGELAFEVAPDGDPAFSLSLAGWGPVPLRLAPDAQLELHNPCDWLQTLQIETLDWQSQACTGALVSSLPEFRSLFAAEAPAISLPLSRQTLLLARLSQSEAEMEVDQAPNPDSATIGIAPDASCFDVLRQAITACDGAEVWCRDQYLLAAFQDPLDGLRAALAAQDDIQRLNRSLLAEAPLALAFGLHEGACEIGSQNGRLDYRGEALDLARFLLALAEAGEILIGDVLLADADIKWLLAQQGCRVLALQLSQPESGQPLTLCRIRPGGRP